MADPPWFLRGEAVVAFCRGPAVIVAARHDASPVGPYLSLGIGRIGRIGLRPGIRFTTMIVDNHQRLALGRRNWGFPGEIGTLTWATVGNESVLVWHERGIEVHAHARGGAFPLVAPGRLVQHRADGPVLVPTRVRGRARRARVDVAVPEGDELIRFAGEHPGLHIAGMATQLREARVPAGRVWSSRAPAAAPDVAT